MKYCDLHCDTLTIKGDKIRQNTREGMLSSGCFLQCFAAFVSEERERFSAAVRLADEFYRLCGEEGFHPVTGGNELMEGMNALFTVEDGGAIEGDLKKLDALYGRGMRMMSLTWNLPNELGFPAFPDYEGLCAGRVSFKRRETERGLTERGREAVERMCELGVLADAAHGSDRLFFETAEICKNRGKPFVVSHTAANSVHPSARNLTDGELKALGDAGGVAGLYYCADFLSDDLSKEGQRRAILAHARAMINAGGEDVLSLGSDFDGIPENPAVRNAGELPWLFDALISEFGFRIAEKICYRNFLRVLSSV